MVSSDELKNFILSELNRICGQEVQSDTSLLMTGLLDSMGLMELIVSVQDRYSLQLDLSQLTREQFDTPILMTEFFLTHNK